MAYLTLVDSVSEDGGPLERDDLLPLALLALSEAPVLCTVPEEWRELFGYCLTEGEGGLAPCPRFRRCAHPACMRPTQQGLLERPASDAEWCDRYRSRATDESVMS